MQKQTKIFMSALILLVLTLSLTSAMTVKSVSATNFQPGSEQDISVKIKNTLNGDVTDVSLTLSMTNLPFSVSGSGDTVDEITSDDSETFKFNIKAIASAKAGDYQIPYTLTYFDEDEDPHTVNGTFTLTVESFPELVYSISTDTPLIGSKAKITLSIVNKGLGDARFVSVTLIPQGYTLLSDENSYIGTVSSDDSETTNFEVIFDKQNPVLNAQVQYRDFNNKITTNTVNLPITVYSQEQALKLGLVKPNNTFLYIIIAGAVIIGWIIVRRVRKKRRLNKAQGR